MLKTLGIPTFNQPDDPSSTRIAGGSFAMIQALADQLPKENIRMDFPVVSCVSDSDTGEIVLTSSEGDKVRAKSVVFAAPPRLLNQKVTFEPALSEERQQAMRRCRTWMAGSPKEQNSIDTSSNLRVYIPIGAAVLYSKA